MSTDGRSPPPRALAAQAQRWVAGVLSVGIPPAAVPIEVRRQVQIVSAVSFATVALGVPFVYRYWQIGIPWMSVAVLITILVGLVNVGVLRRTRDPICAGWLGVLALLGLIVASNVASGGFYDPNFGWLYVIPILAALVVDARAGWVFTGLVLICTIAFWAAPEVGIEIPDQIPRGVHREQSLANRVSALIAIAVVLAALASRERFSQRLLETANVGLRAEMRQRAEMHARLVETERMASMGSLAAGVAHEINNPLTYVLGNLDLIGEFFEDLPPAHREALSPLLEDVLDGAHRVRRIVADLKTYTRTDTHVEVDLSLVLDRAEKLTSAEFKHRARLVRSSVGNTVVVANEARLVQVAVNLLTNAAHAIEPGQHDCHEVHMTVRRDGAHVVWEIGDTGGGMDEMTRERAFEPFFTTKEMGVGTGLGLSICRNLVMGMGGTIEIDSHPGRGTTVVVCLPAADAAARGPVNRRSATAVPPARILALDDEPAILRWLTTALPAHEVVAVTDPQVAVERFVAEGFDLFLCDLMMPNVTGIDVHRAIQQRFPEGAHRLIFMTGGVFTPQAEAFVRAGGVQILDKPIDPAALQAILSSLPQRR